MKTSILVTGIALAIFSSADADAAKFKPQSTFTSSEVEWIYGEGENAVDGTIHIQANTGTLVSCAGRTVALVPHTEFAEERMAYMYGSTTKGTNTGKRLPPKYGPKKYEKQAAEYQQHALTTQCKMDGSFAFENVPDGTYYLTGGVWWQGQSGGAVMGSGVLGGMVFNTPGSVHGKNFMERISVANGDSVSFEFISVQ